MKARKDVQRVQINNLTIVRLFFNKKYTFLTFFTPMIFYNISNLGKRRGNSAGRKHSIKFWNSTNFRAIS